MSEMEMEREEPVEETDLPTALKRLLADEIAMYLMAAGFHWNVEGINFQQFHDFFGAIYADVYSSIDPTAENIRKLGGYAPFMLPTLEKLREIPDDSVSPSAADMVRALANANNVLIEDIDECFQLAQRDNEQGIADFLAARDDMHKKWRWQLEATMK